MKLELKYIRVVLSEGTPLQTEALDISGLNLSLRHRIIGVAGVTGSGKSTLFRLLGGFLKPSSGELKAEGKPLEPPHIMLCMQQPESQLFCSTVKEELCFALKNFGVERDDWDERMEKALEATGPWPGDILKREPLLLSGGQKRRIALASLLVVRPGVLLLDEPVAGLDWPARKRVWETIQIQKKLGGAVVISHEIEELLAHCDRILLLGKGRIVFDGTPLELVSREQGFGLRLKPMGSICSEERLMAMKRKYAG